MTWNPEKIYDRTNKDFKKKDLEEISCVLVKEGPAEQFYIPIRELKKSPNKYILITERRKVIN